MFSRNTALVVIDPQYDFCPGGRLAVADGDAVMAPINALMPRFQTVVVTQDWHPAEHSSFADNHPGRHPFEMTVMPYGPQVLWPAHCIIGTRGAAFHDRLNLAAASLIVRKGTHKHIDSYSAFTENDRSTKTGLDGYLHAIGVSTLYICGLATDFCVSWTAEDAVAFGFDTTVVEDACRAIDLNGSLATAWDRMTGLGVKRATSAGI